MSERKADVGFFSFTEITDVSQHVAYNEWHQLDHMPEQFPIAGIARGDRWVMSPRCRQSALKLNAPFDRIHYVTVYLMGAPIETTLREFYALGEALHRDNRFFDARKSHFARPLSVAATSAAQRVLVRPEAIPARPHRGIYVIVANATTPPAAIGPDEIVELPGVAGVWSFVPSPALIYQQAPWTAGEQSVTVAWIDGDVLETAKSINAHLSKHSNVDATLACAVPFETITPWEWDWFTPR